jgi:hypothetical protein
LRTTKRPPRYAERRTGEAALGPTNARPGTPEKLAVMAERARRELPLFHPGDADHRPPPEPTEEADDEG